MPRNPNIILINCDDLGYGDLGCYGSPTNKTPYLNRLCQDGLKLTDFYAASPVCSPSRASLLTGCYPPRIGFGDFDGGCVLFPGDKYGLSHGERTIAQMLKDVGYATMIIGKWHCGDQNEFLPRHYGFDEYYGLPYSNDMGMRIGTGPGHMPPLPLMQNEEVVQQQPDQAGLTERYTERAIRFLRDQKDAPFFLYFAHMHTHLPHYSPQRFVRESENGDYGAAVAEIDWSVGVLMDELKALNLWEDTLIIFTSDNGSTCRLGGSNGPLRDIKSHTWEGGQRVPCIWHWPGKIAPGESAQLMTNMDFFATLAKLTGGTLPEHKIDSMDMSDVVFRGGQSPRDTFFYYFRDGLEAVRHGKWKLHVYKWKPEGAIRELYDLEADIGETQNVINAHPDVAAQMDALLDECRADIGDAWQGIRGENRRAPGRVDNPKPLTEWNPEHPYIIALYDKDEVG